MLNYLYSIKSICFLIFWFDRVLHLYILYVWYCSGRYFCIIQHTSKLTQKGQTEGRWNRHKNRQRSLNVLMISFFFLYIMGCNKPSEKLKNHQCYVPRILHIIRAGIKIYILKIKMVHCFLIKRCIIHMGAFLFGNRCIGVPTGDRWSCNKCYMYNEYIPHLLPLYKLF